MTSAKTNNAARLFICAMIAVFLAFTFNPAQSFADQLAKGQGTVGVEVATQASKAKIKAKHVKVKSAKLGQSLSSKVTVKVNGKTLKRGKDYTATFKDPKGKRATKATVAGTYKVTVKGKGSYEGAVTKIFKVAKAKASAVATAKNRYKKALDAEAKAKAAYDSSAVQYKAGARGFYRWIADNYNGWRRADALDALRILDTTSFKNYTDETNPDDATSLDNMKKSVDLYPVLEAKRAGDKHHKNLQEASVRNMYIARAQVNSNASSRTYSHMRNDTGCDLTSGMECLAWGYSNPFVGWYDRELVSYEKCREYTLNKYGVDIDSDEWLRFRNSNGFDYDQYLADTKQFGEIGHYNIVCSSGTIIVDTGLDSSDPGYAMRSRADKVFFGLARSGYGNCYCLAADTSDFGGYTDGYSASEYGKLFNSYYDAVYPKTQAKAYEASKAVSSKSLTALKKAATPKKPTKAKRSGKKISVAWKKVADVDGYQISASPQKQGIKVVAKVGKSAQKKTVKSSKAAKCYVKVRSYVKVNGKIVYGKWSKPIRSN